MEKPSRLTPKNVVILAFVILAIGAGFGGMYLADKLYLEPMRQQQKLIANLKLIVEQLTKEERVAEVVVMEQTPERTKFKFVEVNAKNEPVGEPKIFDVAGDVAYFDTLVIKFENDFRPVNQLPLNEKELARQLNNRSIILFRRVFGEKQKPEDGFSLDDPGMAPEIYRLKAAPTQFEEQLWGEFWKLANDPKLAKERGVRAAHGLAVYTKLQKGKYYVLEKRLMGDLTIRPVDVPAVMRQRE